MVQSKCLPYSFVRLEITANAIKNSRLAYSRRLYGLQESRQDESFAAAAAFCDFFVDPPKHSCAALLLFMENKIPTQEYCTQETHQEQLNLEGLKHSLTQSIWTNECNFLLFKGTSNANKAKTNILGYCFRFIGQMHFLTFVHLIMDLNLFQ